MSERRVAITIKGGVSLGAYEAGVLTETLRLMAFDNNVPDAKHKWYVDVLSGASAGSVTAAITAIAMVSGETRLLHDIWVKLLSLDRLAPRDDPNLSNEQLLDASALDELAREHLSLPTSAIAHPALHPTRKIRFGFTLSHLYGELDVIRTITNENLAFNRYRDFVSFTLALQADGPLLRPSLNGEGFAAGTYQHPSKTVTGADAWDALIQCAIASGSFPFAFAPRLLRKWIDGANWTNSYFEDGGIYDNDPVGQAINLAHEVDWYGPESKNFKDSERRFLIVHTAPFKSRGATMIPGAQRLLKIDPLQLATTLLPNIFDALAMSGLSSIGDFNQLFAVRRAFLNKLVQQLQDNKEPVALPSMVSLLAQMRGIAADQLKVLKEAIVSDLAGSSNAAHRDLVQRVTALGFNREAFEEATLAFDLALDIADKVEFYPILVAPSDKLAGDPVSGFGGFLLQALRERDFQQGVFDAYREWQRVAAITVNDVAEFTLAPNAPSAPPSAEAVAEQVAPQYAVAVKRLVERLQAVVAGLANAAGRNGVGGLLKRELIKAIGDQIAKSFAEAK